MPRKPPNDPSDPKTVDLGALASKKNFDSYQDHYYTGEPDIPFFDFLSGKGKQTPLIVFGSDNSEYVILSSFNDEAAMEDGDDIAVGGPGNDTIFGGEGDDYLFGDTDLGLGDVNWEVDDVLNGENGDDLIVGDSPNLFNNAVGGEDTLTGGTGNDTLWGDGTLWDFATGGADWFVFETADGQDVIKDFRTADEDRIVLYLSQIKWADLDTDDSGFLDDGDDYVSLMEGSTLIDLGGASGATGNENTLLVESVVGLTSDDFIFL